MNKKVEKEDSIKMFFDHITNMRTYCGFEVDVIGGGRYVEKEGYGHELFNFLNDKGKCYGHTAPWGSVKLDRISEKDISEDAFGKYLDGVLVVFTCEGKNGGRVIAGFYQNARVYAKWVKDDRSSRLYKGKPIKYNLICDSSDAVLISQGDRNFEIPRASSKGSGGYGRFNIWYADKDIEGAIRNGVLQYIEDILKGDISDETKYSLYNENETHIITTERIKRSQKARNECIKLRGCYCNICGFDFEKTYGGLGKDYIEVHHITSIGALTTSTGYAGTDPSKDLIPLCSNCHSMIHRKSPPYGPDEIKTNLTPALI
jgi:5-methylcytosine-specific restriction protein A